MNKKIIAGVAAVILLGASFYAGMVYGKSSTPAQGQLGSGQFMGNAAGMGGGMGMGALRGETGGGTTAGEIIAKDETSMTVKMKDGSTKIVLIGTGTQVTKTAAGTLGDLTSGTDIVVTGSANSDGSITAQSVQIRPAGDATPRQ